LENDCENCDPRDVRARDSVVEICDHSVAWAVRFRDLQEMVPAGIEVANVDHVVPQYLGPNYSK
jgi:hypothetical protein